VAEISAIRVVPQSSSLSLKNVFREQRLFLYCFHYILRQIFGRSEKIAAEKNERGKKVGLRKL